MVHSDWFMSLTNRHLQLCIYIRYRLLLRDVDFVTQNNIVNFMGKTRDISTTKKASILALSRGNCHTVQEIATQMQVSKRTVQRVRRVGSTESFRNGRCGRRRITTTITDRYIRRKALKERMASSHRLAANLRSAGINISKDTVKRRLKEQGVMSVKSVQKPYLMAAMCKKRLDWAKCHENWTVKDWSKLIFSSESTFMCQSASAHQMWHQQGQPTPTTPTVKHPTKVMVWSAMCTKGAGRLHVVERNMNSGQYCHVILSPLVPQIKEWFPGGGYTFMQDGAPCHTSRRSKECLATHQIPVLPWPGNSPDLNPIETLWAIVKRRLRSETVNTKNVLIAGIIKVWLRDATLPETCQKLIASMPARVKAVIKANGGNTNN